MEATITTKDYSKVNLSDLELKIKEQNKKFKKPEARFDWNKKELSNEEKFQQFKAASGIDIDKIKKENAVKEYKEEVSFWKTPAGKRLNEIDELLLKIAKLAPEKELIYLIEAAPELRDPQDLENEELIKEMEATIGTWEQVFSYWTKRISK
jgi:hypothetical protein